MTAQHFIDFAELVTTSANRDEWLLARRQGLGASDVPSVLGVGFRTPAEVWAEKAGKVEPDDLSEIERIEWGNRLEPLVIAAYSEARYAGRRVERAGELLRSRIHPWALATLDAVAFHPEFGWIPLEVKTTSAFNADDWAEGPPEAYFLQVQAQLLVTGAPCASIACLIGGQRLVWCDILRDEVTIARIVAVCGRFWGHVEAGQIVEPDSSPEWASIFGAVAPELAGKVEVLSDDDRALVAEFVEAKAARKSAEEREQAAKNALLWRIGDAEEARFPDGQGFTYRTQTRGEHVVKASTFRVLRESAAPKKAKSNRRAA